MPESAAKVNARRVLAGDPAARIVNDYPAHGVSYHGVDHEGYEGGGHHLEVGAKWVDIWGTGWHKEHAGVMGFPRDCPLKDLPQDLPSFAWPDPDDERICGRIYQDAEGYDPDAVFLTASHRDTLWEKASMLVGMEDLMCFFFTEPGAVKDLFHGIMDFQLGIARHYREIGVEAVRCSDDLGTQDGPLLSPAIVAEFLVPEYRRLMEFYQRDDVLIDFHSCGHIEPLLETFMALGIDVLNPVQATANNLDAVRARTRGRLTLKGGVATKTIMDGPPVAIREEVTRRIEQLGAEGRYFCCPDQGLPFPEEHAAAWRQAVEELG